MHLLSLVRKWNWNNAQTASFALGNKRKFYPDSVSLESYQLVSDALEGSISYILFKSTMSDSHPSVIGSPSRFKVPPFSQFQNELSP